ncbi:MAG: DUF1489 domain-containing protein [Rhodovulum sulfidophilum]|uniref:DUF1489 domain-containing protein n=1 Tax=Rhodovulum sulfidophilum TaxID=35806 RepID=A0A2W5NA98_RHOSU|nr:MAG: DUF1489 domain-containing protein [Rhodovulum sulfidophilum]
MSASLHLVKLCVGAEAVADLVGWQAARMEEARAEGREPLPRHVTRMWPKREAELLDGGSLYWVFKGLILARQRILSLDRVEGADGVQRCAIVLDPAVVRVEPRPRRPFQGWRYLAAAEAPGDLASDGGPELPTPLARELALIGVV